MKKYDRFVGNMGRVEEYSMSANNENDDKNNEEVIEDYALTTVSDIP